MVSDRLKAVLAEFGARIECAGLVPQDGGVARFVCDARFVVGIADEPGTDRVRVFALAGQVAGFASEACPELHLDDDAWEPIAFDDGPRDEAVLADDHAEALEDFALRLRFHEDAGAVAVVSAAPLCMLDAVRFAEWIERFLDRLVETAARMAACAEAPGAPGAIGPLP